MERGWVGGVSEEGGWRRSAAGASSSSPPPYHSLTHTHTFAYLFHVTLWARLALCWRGVRRRGPNQGFNQYTSLVKDRPTAAAAAVAISANVPPPLPSQQPIVQHSLVALLALPPAPPSSFTPFSYPSFSVFGTKLVFLILLRRHNFFPGGSTFRFSTVLLSYSLHLSLSLTISPAVRCQVITVTQLHMWHQNDTSLLRHTSQVVQITHEAKGHTSPH